VHGDVSSTAVGSRGWGRRRGFPVSFGGCSRFASAQDPDPVQGTDARGLKRLGRASPGSGRSAPRLDDEAGISKVAETADVTIDLERSRRVQRRRHEPDERKAKPLPEKPFHCDQSVLSITSAALVGRARRQRRRRVRRQPAAARPGGTRSARRRPARPGNLLFARCVRREHRRAMPRRPGALRPAPATSAAAAMTSSTAARPRSSPPLPPRQRRPAPPCGDAAPPPVAKKRPADKVAPSGKRGCGGRTCASNAKKIL